MALAYSVVGTAASSAGPRTAKVEGELRKLMLLVLFSVVFEDREFTGCVRGDF